jgi:hypothetical protein
VARNTGHPFEMFDYLPEALLDPGELSGVFNIIRNVWSHQPTVFDLNDDLAAFGHTDA